ncbi:hypothetical protein B9J87_08425, partial [Vibrio sp. V19_P1S1T109]
MNMLYKKNITLMLFMFPILSYSAVFDINAEYKPDAFMNGAEFINTTPCYTELSEGLPWPIGFCNTSAPMKDTTIVSMPVNLTRTPKYNGVWRDDLFYFKVFKPKTIMLNNFNG